MKMTFTMSELKSMTLPELKKLFTWYYPDENSYNLTKAKIIPKIYGAANQFQIEKELPPEDEVELPRSVRVRRIYANQQKENGNG